MIVPNIGQSGIRFTRPALRRKRELRLESLEERRLLIGPQLSGVQANEGNVLFSADNAVEVGTLLNVAPRELTFQFDDGQVINASTVVDAIEITRSGLDGQFGDDTDITVTAGFIGIGGKPNEVVYRFSETLPDDIYRVEIFGRGADALFNENISDDSINNGRRFNGGRDLEFQFTLDLGAQIVAVVPQPIRRDSLGDLSQARNQIHVYFNEDDLHHEAVDSMVDWSVRPAVVNPEFYRLIYTNETVFDTDDVEVLPILVDYDPATDMAVLTFADDLDQLVPQNSQASGWTYRLNIGSLVDAPTTGSLEGIQWSDNNGNGLRDADELVLPGWTIYLDKNGNSQMDEDEPSQITDEKGRYRFSDLEAGTYTVREVHQDGWQPTFPVLVAGELGLIDVKKDGIDGIDGLEYATSIAINRDADRVYVTAGRDPADANVGDNSLSVFRRTEEGELELMETLTNGVNSANGLGFANHVAVSPDGQFVYVTSIDSRTLAVFQHDSTTNGLEEIQVLRDGIDGVTGLRQPYSLSVSQDGANVYVADSTRDVVSIFSRDLESTSGELSFTGITASGELTAARNSIVSPDGRHVYVTAEFDDTVTVFERDSSGSLSHRQTVRDGDVGVDGLDGAHSLGISASGDYLYVGALGDDAVTVFQRNNATGELTLVQQLTHGMDGVSGIKGPVDIVVSPDDQYVYVAGKVSDSIAIFEVNSNSGMLHFSNVIQDGVGGVDGLDGVTSIAVDEAGENIYAVSVTDGLATFQTENSEKHAVVLELGASISGLDFGNRPINSNNIPAQEIGAFEDAGASFATATGLGILDQSGRSLRAAIDQQGLEPYPFNFPGDNAEPGHRDIDDIIENHVYVYDENTLFGVSLEDTISGELAISDNQAGVRTQFYNFRTDYGVDPHGTPLANAITPEQMQRAREVFQIYGDLLGIQFVETDNQGLTIAVGDLREGGWCCDTGPGGVLARAGWSSNGQPLAILDAAEIWDDAFGFSHDPTSMVSWFQEGMSAIGHLIGIGFSSELPPLTLSAGNTFGENALEFADAGPVEPIFPGDHDVVHGQYMLRPESRDIDIYRFELSSNGRFAAETFAERLSMTSLLNTALALYREIPGSDYELVARNDDYFSDDSLIQLDLAAGVYFIAVSASGNTQFDPLIVNSGLAGTTEGDYELQLSFEPQAENVLRETMGLVTDGVRINGTELDGDADGIPGGAFNFWFRVQNEEHTQFVDKAAFPGGDGSLAWPFRTLSDAFTAAEAGPTIGGKITPGDIVRIVGNGDIEIGEDGLDLTGIEPFVIGVNDLFQPLEDGTMADVPAGITVMIDEGAVFKLHHAAVSVGSVSVAIDRSASGLQVLGTPRRLDDNGDVIRDADNIIVPGSVYFTSFNDEEIGADTNPNVEQTPAAGDWGGLIFNAKLDNAEGHLNLEDRGIFLNSVNQADIRYGGGAVVIDSIPRVITPVHITDTRPTVAYNRIVFSADAGMSASPNSFEETNFRAPLFQAIPFIPDYDRVGPDIHGNRLTDNTINGLFIRIQTPSGTQLQPMTVPGRWDDTDITHVVADNLVVLGTPGGPLDDADRPSVERVVVTSQESGDLPEGTYHYRVTFVDADGNEGPASLPTRSQDVVTGQGSLRLENLPQTPYSPLDFPQAFQTFVARRIYRSNSSSHSTGPYTLVAVIDRENTSFVDDGSSLPDELQDLSPVRRRARLDARLAIDPGTIVKLNAGSIETVMSSQLIAEGTQSRAIVFTSIRDDSHGAGGTFDSNNDDVPELIDDEEPLTDPVSVETDPEPGDWAGLFIGHVTSASLDHAVVAYGGGVRKIAGSFSGFNTLEIHQANARIANSSFEYNADGLGGQAPETRDGRGFNTAGTIFVRGAQPVIVNNIIRDSLGPAVSINVNALNHEHVVDSGRMTGLVDFEPDTEGNQGPLVRGNRLRNNAINGMQIRGGTLTTEGVWDDTDIVHVVLDGIYVPDFHTYGGLRLESSSSESLIVKLEGSDAGFTATGRPLDIEDRIGGMLHIIGQPDHPVVMTALADDTVGAGLDPENNLVIDTNNNGNETGFVSVSELPTGPEEDNGTLIDDDVSITVPGFFSFRSVDGGSAPGPGDAADGGVTVDGVTGIFQDVDVIFDYFNMVDVGSDGGAVILGDTNITTPAALIGDDLVASEGNFDGENGVVSWRVESRMDDGIPIVFNTITLTSDDSLGNLRFINYLDEDVFAVSDDLLYQIGIPGEADFRVFTLDDPERVGFSQGGSYEPGLELVNATYDGFAADQFPELLFDLTGAGTNYAIDGNIDEVSLPPFNDARLGPVHGPRDVTTAFAWTVDPTANSATITVFLELIAQDPTGPAVLPGAWRSITLDQFSHDRNVEVITERELPDADLRSGNSAPSSAEFIGELAPTEKSSDDNQRLGFTILGLLDERSDVDVYSFTAEAGTEVWFDIDRTVQSLDTVVELVDAAGNILALSNDAEAERHDPTLLFRDRDKLSTHHVNPLQSRGLLVDQDGELISNTSPFRIPDRWTTNPLDAGMRVVLPGPTGAEITYFVRVRSSNLGLNDDWTGLIDEDRLFAGRTLGPYQLQLRLRELDELAGSTVQFADIRFATNGIELIGQPAHSPLLGEAAEVIDAEGNDNNDTFETALELGNLLNTDRATLSVTGELTGFDDIDWYRFDVDFDSIRDFANLLHAGVTLDLDYADGLARPDTNLWVFDENFNLILNGTDSNVADDRPGPLQGTGLTDLSRGSTGVLDPLIGPIELPAVQRIETIGNSLGTGVYYVAVAANHITSQEIQQFTSRDPVNPLARYEPIDSLQRVADDNIGMSNFSQIAEDPVIPVLFDVTSPVGFELSDVTLLVSAGIGQDESHLVAIDPFTGERENVVGAFGYDVGDLALHPNGSALFSFTTREEVPTTDANTGNYLQIDPGSLDTQNLATNLGDDGIETYVPSPEDPAEPATAECSDPPEGCGVRFEAITLEDFGDEVRGYAVGSRLDLVFAAQNPAFPLAARNILFEFDPASGVAFTMPGLEDREEAEILEAGSPGTQIRDHGVLDTETDFIVQGENVLVLPQATAMSQFLGPAQTVFQIIDGQDQVHGGTGTSGFTVQDGAQNFQFEFNSGPEVTFELAELANSDDPIDFVRDGDIFTLDGTVFEFDTGSVIVFREEDGFNIGEGNTVTITDNNENTRIFEFDSDGVLNVLDAIAVPFNTLMFPVQLMERLVDEINFVSQSSNFTVLADISDNTNRVTLFNESLDAASGVVSNSAGIQIEGAPGISHDVRIPVEETDENFIDQLATIENDFASAIVQAFATAEGNEIIASRDGNRINFSGATTADFSEIVARDVFTVVTSSDSFTSPGSIGIDFLAQDAPEDLALKIVTAINENTTATASLVGVNGVRLLGNAEFGDIQEPLRLGGQAPGGVITGMTFLNNRLYAVTGDDPFTFGLVEGGGLFEIVGFAGSNATLDYVETSVVLTAVDQNGDPTDEPIDFAGLVSGPANAADGRFAETLFGIDTNGNLYAFSEAGIPVPAFVDGKSAIHTNLPSLDVQGLAFAKLDVNLWHATDQRGTDPGHRLQRTFDGLRDLEDETSSFYFGYEDQATLGTDLSAPLTQNNYNFIGGAHGVLESSPFSLKGYSPADRPALYFDYYLDTEQANASQRFDDTFMRDSFRVYIGGEDGIWRLLSTNNSHTEGGDFNDELDAFGSLVSTAGLEFEEVFAQPLQTQQAFDVNEEFEGTTSPDSWRQIRVPLDEYAGRDQLRLRFEFSTAGGLGPALLTSAARDNTVGVELFAVAGNSVVDGGTLDEEVFQISTPSNRFFSGFGFDETVSFEFEMGPTLVAMSGGAIDDGASIWVDGKYYEFDKDGLLNNTGLNAFAIPIDDQMTPEQVAREIDLAIVSNHSIPLTADLFQESNDTVSTAIATGLFGFTSTFSAAGTLGDNQNLNAAGLDVDFLAVELKSGDTIQVDIDAQELNGGLNDSYLRLFDNRFVEKANNDNRSGPGENPSLDSFLSFTVEDPGTYYVGISSAGNTAYNPTFEASGESENTGDYHVEIAIIQPRAATPVDILLQESNDTLATAASIGLTGMSSKFVAAGVIGDNLTLDDRFVFLAAEEDEDLDVDLISIQLSAGDTIAVDIDTLGLSGSLSDSFLRIFDANGNELERNDDGRAPGEDESADSFLLFTAPITDKYVVGVSGDNNRSYFPSVSGFGEPGVVGSYQIEIVLDVTEAITQQSGHLVNLPLSSSVVIDGLPSSFVDGVAGIQDSTAEPVHIHLNMTREQVAEQVRGALADRYAGGFVEAFSRRGDLVHVIGHSVVDPGPLGVTGWTESTGDLVFGASANGLFGDQFGAFEISTNFDGTTDDRNQGFLRGQDNDYEGVYVDNIVIGFAERGEMVTGGDANSLFDIGVPAETDIFEGTYQLEIRRSTEFGIPEILAGPADSPSYIFLLRSFDTNDRLDLSTTIVAPFGYQIVEGQTFTITDGTDSIIFEFDDSTYDFDFDPLTMSDGVSPGNIRIPYLPGDTDVRLAARIRDAINSNSVQSVLDVSAAKRDGEVAGLLSTSHEVNLYGNATVELSSFTDAITDANRLRNEILGPDDVTVDDAKFVDGIAGFRQSGFGDSNTFRDQGQIIIRSNRITNSAEYGINVGPGNRIREDLVPMAGDLPHAGPLRTLPETNLERQVPGATIENNILAGNVTGGIRFSGDPNGLNLQLGAVPFGRILNNTIYGNATEDVGIRVENNASPTLMNNIVANFSEGIVIDETSESTVVSATLYQDVPITPAATLGDFPIVLSATDPLFVNPEDGNFYLAAGSAAIDSSMNSLDDRPNLTLVRDPLGIGRSPILAPERDANGQIRTDDPQVGPPPGVGENIFIDRGAVDRTDFIGPLARLLTPQDNDAAGNDNDPEPTIVQINSASSISQLEIQLVDMGVAGMGVDVNTVNGDQVTVLMEGEDDPLEQGVIYTFRYDFTNDVIILQPLSGVWLPGTYVINLNNRVIDEDDPANDPDVFAGIFDRAGNPLQANQTDGETRFTIVIGDYFDFGDAPDIYPVLAGSDGAQHGIRRNFHLGSAITFEVDGTPDTEAAGDVGDDGVTFDTTIHPGVNAKLTVTSSAVGRLDAWMDFDADGDWTADERIIDNATLVGGGVANTFDVAIPAWASEEAFTFSRFRFSSLGGLAPSGAAADGEVEDYQIRIGSATPWQNTQDPFDVNNDGVISAADVFIIASYITFNGSQALPVPPSLTLMPPPFYDVNGDNFITPADVFMVARVIDQENRSTSGTASAVQQVMNSPSQVSAEMEGTIDLSLDFPKMPSAYPIASSGDQGAPPIARAAATDAILSSAFTSGSERFHRNSTNLLGDDDVVALIADDVEAKWRE